ncbi:MAG: hypothetical protein NC102_08080 [Clostridium sp.]|nr:hypothetical protein [Clostridium sp.]
MTKTSPVRAFIITLSLLFCGLIAFAQDEIVSVKMNGVPLVEVLKSIEAQTPYRFSYRNAILEGLDSVSINRSGASLKDVLQEILPPLNIDYKVESPKSISLFKMEKPAPKRQVATNGSVVDAFLDVPLPDVKVELLSAADSSKIMDVDVLRLNNRQGRLEYAQYFLTLDCAQKYILHGSLDGYEDAWIDIDVPANPSGLFSVGDLKMQRVLKKNLNEVVVTATKVKMFWKGDTIVYDASAFKMPEGSMLDDLIRQMPGVALNDDGEIFVNGRKVDELLLGSKSFFHGKSQVLLKNLPYYTVKNIKVYEKSSDLSQALGQDVDDKKYVMDVNLKQEYNSGMMANVEAAAGTSGRFLGRGFLLGFADPYRFSVAGNANNVNESRHIGQSDNWKPEKMPTSNLTTRSVAAELSYDNKKVEETFSAEYASLSDRVDMFQRREAFINGATPISLLQSNTLDRNKTLKLHNYLKLTKPWIILDLNYSCRTFSSRFNSSTDQYDGSMPTNSLSDFGFGSGSAWKFNGHASSHIIIDRNSAAYFNYYLEFTRSVEGSESMRQYDFILPKDNPLHNANNFCNKLSSGLIWLTIAAQTKSRITFSFDEQIYLEHTKKHDYLYHPDTLMLPSQRDALLAITDFANSYDSRYDEVRFNSMLSVFKTKVLPANEMMRMPFSYRIWNLNLKLRPYRRNLHYRRGQIDENVVANDFVFNPELAFNFYPKNRYNENLNIALNHNAAPPSLYDRIDYRDDSRPLVVKLGNPGLKGTQVTHAHVKFYSRGVNQRLFHAEAAFDFWHRSVAQSVAYDPVSGVYAYRPVNVNGAYAAKFDIDYTRSFGKSKAWTWSNSTNAAFNHSVDHTMLQGQTHSRVNAVNTLSLHDGFYFQFDKSGLNLRASADVNWRHSAGKMADFSALNAVDFHYGLSARYTIPGFKTTLAADGTMFSRHGYGYSALNANDFILNASISQPMMKGRLVARIEAFDILRQLSQTQYEVNAQGRIETWYRSLPHYLMLHLAYHFNLTPKKK